MGLFDNLDIEHLIEKAIAHIDLESIAADVMTTLRMESIDLFFIVDKQPDSDEYDLLGIAYSHTTAKEMCSEARETSAVVPEILKLDIAKTIPLAKELGIMNKVI